MSAPQLEFPMALWTGLIDHLRQQGRGVRESGAFLLGARSGDRRWVKRFLPYEELQADALNEDYVSLSAASFSKLWDVCQKHSMSVVADVHTHRFGPQQSRSDCANPMVALTGHIALIVPRFAQGVIRLEDIGIHQYEGSHKWKSHFGELVSQIVQMKE